MTLVYEKCDDMYSKPKKEIDQGDIFENIYFYSRDERRSGVLVTPVCQIDQRKADYLTFCGIFSFAEVVKGLIENCWQDIPQIIGETDEYDKLHRKQKEKIFNKLKLLRSNFNLPRYHWLNPFSKNQDVHIIDFQVVASLYLKEVKDVSRICSINSPYREEIPVRYSTYMARIGVPEMRKEEADTILESAAKKIFDVSKTLPKER